MNIVITRAGRRTDATYSLKGSTEIGVEVIGSPTVARRSVHECVHVCLYYVYVLIKVSIGQEPIVL